jgi:hypothetical protein
MTTEQAMRLYVAAGGHNDHSADEREHIRTEMQAIVAAKSDRAAGRTIDWWGCWDRTYTATAFARRVRTLHQHASGNDSTKGA